LATFGNFAKRKVADTVVAGTGVADDTAATEPLTAASEAQASGFAAGDLPDDLVEVGFVVDAYGVKGWVKIQPHAQDGHGGDAMVRARRWWVAARLPVVGRPVGKPAGQPAGQSAGKAGDRPAGGAPAGSRDEPRMPLRLVSVSEAKMHSGSVVAHMAGFADRDQALAAKGMTVHVRRADFPKLSQDEFYWVDLIGLAVINTEGEALGEVVGLIDNGAHSVMRIAADSAFVAEERLIPFVDAYVRGVDLEARRIVVDWGLDY
jgi:16S rRNA processing protein RimM